MVGKASDGGQGPGANAPGAGDPITINVGGEARQFTSEQIATALDRAGNLERTVEQLSGFQKVLTQYGVTPDEYLRNSEASFALANSLIQQGIIDESGTVIDKTKAAGDTPPKTPIIPTGIETGTVKKLQTIEKALLALGNKMESLEDGQSGLYRRNVTRDVRAAHPELDDADISKLLALAASDKSKTFWDHATVAATEKTARTTQQVNMIAKTTIDTLIKAGIIPEGKIDTKDFDLNKLKEQDPSGGAPVYEGKKFMFGSRQRRLGKNAEGFVAPSESMKEMLDQKLK